MYENIKIAIFRTINATILCLAAIAFIYALGTTIFILTGLFRASGVVDSWEFSTTEPYMRFALTAICFFLGSLALLGATPFGEALIRAFVTTRDISERELEKIQHIVKELEIKYLKKFEEPLKINLSVVDSNDLNGFSSGYSTIAINRIVLKMATDEEIAGLLSHEIGHLHYRDGSFNSLRFIIGCLFSLMPSRKNKNEFINHLSAKSPSSNGGFEYIIGLLIFFIIITPIFAAIIILIPLLILFSWTNQWECWPQEYRADSFAVIMGHGEGLASLLDRIADMDERTNTGFLAKYQYSHPPIESRINRLKMANSGFWKRI